LLVAHAVAIADRLVALDAERAARRKTARRFSTGPGLSSLAPPSRALLGCRRASCARSAFNGTISQTSGKWEACLRALIADPEAESSRPDLEPGRNRFRGPYTHGRLREGTAAQMLA